MPLHQLYYVSDFFLNFYSDLLEVCDYEKYKDSINLEKELNASEDEFEDDFAVVIGCKKSKLENDEEHRSDVVKNGAEDDFIDNDYSEDYDSDQSFKEDSDELEDLDAIARVSNKKLQVDRNSTQKKRDALNFGNHYEKRKEGKVPTVQQGDTSRMKNLHHLVVKDSKRSEENVDNAIVFVKQDLASRTKTLRDFITEESEVKCSDESNDDDSNGCRDDIGGKTNQSHKRKKRRTESENIKLREDIYGRLRDVQGNIVRVRIKFVIIYIFRTFSAQLLLRIPDELLFIDR